MNLFKLSLVGLLLQVTICPLYAQTLTGTVEDARTGEPLEGAVLIQQQTEHGTTSDAEGRFELELLADEAPIVEIRFIGYSSQSLMVTTDIETTISLVPSAILGEDILVRAFKVEEGAPVTFTNIDKERLNERNLGQDLPILLEMSPSVVSTSDAGAGIGYTGMRIRGVDQQRINVTINGIPLNDAESHGVFWVNMPDFASSLENVQIQRGVGTSSHGPAAFGATVNLQTETLNPDSYGEISSSFGSFNTLKNNLQFGTGLMENDWALDGRLSRITSDGYIDRASSELQSFYVSGSRHTEESMLKLNVFSGQEETYHAWYGVPENMLEENRRFNPAGQFTDPDGETRFYDNQTDNYTQTHYQAHYSRELSDEWSGNVALHYTRGRGYFEEFRNRDDLSFYGLGPVEVGDDTIDETDLIRRRHLDNHFYGFTFSSDYTPGERWNITIGGGLNHYDGDHFGEVIWARVFGDNDPTERYYENIGEKSDGNFYAKSTIHLTDRLQVMGDLQFRHIDYTIDGVDNDQRVLDQKHQFTFFNPKTGVSFELSEQGRVYGYLGIANKEPVRRDFTDASPGVVPDAERLYDVEAGYRRESSRLQLGLNSYFMWYEDQLINTGEINESGAPVRTNVPESYRAGVELEAAARLAPRLQWSGNLTLSQNRIPEFTEYVDRYDQQGNFLGQEEFTHENTAIAFSPPVTGASQLSWFSGGLRADWYSRYAGRQYLDNTENINRSLDPWWINDVRVSYEWSEVPILKNLQIELMVNNVLDHKYESNGYTFGYYWGDEHIQENYYFPQAGRHVLGGIRIDI